MTTHSRTLKLTDKIYTSLGKPPTVDLAFVGHDLLICAGRSYEVSNFNIIAPDRRMLLRRDTFIDELQFLAGRWTCVVHDCAQHFYMEYTPYAGRIK